MESQRRIRDAARQEFREGHRLCDGTLPAFWGFTTTEENRGIGGHAVGFHETALEAVAAYPLDKRTVAPGLEVGRFSQDVAI